MREMRWFEFAIERNFGVMLYFGKAKYWKIYFIHIHLLFFSLHAMMEKGQRRKWFGFTNQSGLFKSKELRGVPNQDTFSCKN